MLQAYSKRCQRGKRHNQSDIKPLLRVKTDRKIIELESRHEANTKVLLRSTEIPHLVHW